MIPVTEAETTAPRRSGRGGWRPGAGRKRKSAPAPPPEPTPRVPTIGETVLFADPVRSQLGDPTSECVTRPAVVIHVMEPGNPSSLLYLTVFMDGGALRELVLVPFSPDLRGGCWSWRR
jgi:hypothetical protein